MIFTKDDLRTMREHLAPLLVVEPRPLTAEQKVKLGHVIEKIDRAIAETRSQPERGELVFEWRVPKEWALTLNAYAGKPGWSKRKIRIAMDDALRSMLPRFPKANLHGAKLRRWVRITRFSPNRPDEIACDALGGKCPIDALKRCGIIHDDNDRFLIREARWEKIKRGESVHVLVEVWSVTSEGTDASEPKYEPVEQIRYEPGPMTKAILGGR